MSNPTTPLLDTVRTPDELRALQPEQLRQLADELRAETIAAVGVTGGHLGSGLGVVELTTALHYVFNTPDDKLIWDVGHQCYPHKILTGRRDRIRTLRQGDGLSGFTKRAESDYDPFGAAHSSTSISAALGFAIANKMQDKPGKAIAVIGDGAMSAGMAYEAMNNAREAGNRLVGGTGVVSVVFQQPTVGIPAVVATNTRAGQLDKTHALFHKAPSHQALHPKCACVLVLGFETIKLPGCPGLALDINQLRHGSLHAICHLVVGDRRLKFINVTQPVKHTLVELVQQTELGLLRPGPAFPRLNVG